jgi:hypothetical protein
MGHMKETITQGKEMITITLINGQKITTDVFVETITGFYLPENKGLNWVSFQKIWDISRN